MSDRNEVGDQVPESRCHTEISGERLADEREERHMHVYLLMDFIPLPNRVTDLTLLKQMPQSTQIYTNTGQSDALLIF